jgi:uncharacterized cofD-like protein
MPSVLRGLRRHVTSGGIESLTAVVTMSDDGGSSGRLRRMRGLPPPGDVRNCLVALSPDEDLLAGLFQFRYDGSEELGGHTVGNLILAALAEQTGSFLHAVEVSSRVLRVAGRILPATLSGVTLEAVLDDASTIVGETAIATCGKKIQRVGLRPHDAKAAPGIVDAILGADLVIVGPGSIYTSLVPNLLVGEIGAALRTTSAMRVLVANLVSERGEAADLRVNDHIAILEAHASGPTFDAVLVNNGLIEDAVTNRYRAEGSTPLYWEDTLQHRVRVFQRDLIAAGAKLRHDPDATCDGLFEIWAARAEERPVRAHRHAG